jgi:exopolysaccharide production protein ExoQ
MLSPDQYLDGSPLDALIFAGLELAALWVLLLRRSRSEAFLRANGPLLLFFLYCAISIIWSDYPFVAFKRWIKAVGNLLMVLVVLTDPDPRAAVRGLLARTGFLLIPFSVLLVKYFPEVGRGYDAWTGRAFYSGVGVNKNSLGVVCLVFGLGSLWGFLGALRRRRYSRVSGPLLAQSAVLAAALWLFSIADSATSLGCFIVGSVLIVLTSLGKFALRPMFIHVFAVVILSVSVYGVLINTDVGLVQTLGREATLSTRTDLWATLLRVPVDPLLGTGFESFWLGDRVKKLWATYWWHPNQAHNGYLEMYLNLGWLGVALLAFVMGWGYRNVVKGLQRDPDLGGLKAALFMAAVLYNLTEAAFKVVHPVWVIFLLAVVVVPRVTPRSKASRAHHFVDSSGNRTASGISRGAASRGGSS